MIPRFKINPFKLTGLALLCFMTLYAVLALLFGACWQYAINTALELADKSENYIDFGTAYILGLIPWINTMGIAAAFLALAATFIVPLFM